VTLRFAIPTNNELLDDTVKFLAACGVRISRRSSRSLSASVGGVPDSIALFQRSADIPMKIEEGTADLAIVGLDRYLESTSDGSDAVVLHEDLGYGMCRLMLAVPEAWVDVESVYDLADLSVTMREQGKELRVATKYPKLTGRFLYQHGMNYFSLVGSAGAMEAAPLMGYADVIADIVETGNTLRENRLKTLADGCVLESRAVLVGNLRTLSEDPSRRETLRIVLELIEGRLNADDNYSVTANVQGESEKSVVAAVLQHPEITGLQGPTVSRVYSKDGQPTTWHAVTVVVQRSNLIKAIDDFRAVGASGITASPASYVFRDRSPSYDAFLEATKRLEG
jgi:ATP phosphoribosyltransferase